MLSGTKKSTYPSCTTPYVQLINRSEEILTWKDTKKHVNFVIFFYLTNISILSELFNVFTKLLPPHYGVHSSAKGTRWEIGKRKSLNQSAELLLSL